MRKASFLLACVASSVLIACGSKDNTSSSPSSNKPAPVATAAQPGAPLPSASSSVALEQHQKLSPEGLIYLYHALSGLPIDYEKIAGQASAEFRSTTDTFKKKEILEALKPQINAGIANAKSSGRYLYLDFQPGQVSLGHYDLGMKSFPIKNLPTDEGSYLSLTTSPYRLVFTNGSSYKALPMSDEAKAREVEAAIAHGIKVGYTSYSDVFPTTSRVYLFAQASDSNQQAVKFQIVKLVIKTTSDQPFAEM